MTRYLDSPVGNFEDEDLRQLVTEISRASGVHAEFQNFVPFLISSQFPGGAGTKRIPLYPSRTLPGFLETRIEKITSQSILQLCGELAAVIHEPLEMHINRKLMTFLNRVVYLLLKKAQR